jgi:trigger factor
MQVTLETTSGLERKMRVSVPSDKLENQVEAKLKQTAQQVRLKGFRPGKVPMREVQRRFGDGIRQEVSSEMIQSSFNEAIAQESVAPAGMPQIEDVVFEAGQDLQFTAIFEVFPEVEPGDFSSIEVAKPVAEITEDDIAAMIERLQEQRIEYAEVERAAAADDKVNLDFEGLVDDEPFDGNSAEGADIVIGAGSMIPGFEDELVGCKAGESKDLSVKFPDDYHVEELKGKDAIFKTTINRVSEAQRPELNDEFFTAFGVKEGGMEAFEAEIRSNMTRELENAVKTKTKNQAMDGLLANTTVEVPQALADSEIDRLKQEAVQQFGGNQQIDPSVLPSEMFESQAKRRVSLGLIINAIVDQFSVEVDNDRVKETIDKLASSYDDPDQVVNFYYSNEQQMNQVRNMVLEEQVVDLILEKANVSEVSMSYEDAVKPDEPAPADETQEPDEADAEAQG